MLLNVSVWYQRRLQQHILFNLRSSPFICYGFSLLDIHVSLSCLSFAFIMLSYSINIIKVNVVWVCSLLCSIERFLSLLVVWSFPVSTSVIIKVWSALVIHLESDIVGHLQFWHLKVPASDYQGMRYLSDSHGILYYIDTLFIY